VDRVCCDAQCDTQCSACDVSGSEGTCSAVTGPPHGNRTACNGTPPCGGTCNGRLTDTCSYPSGSSCGTEVGCADGGVTAQECNGFGDCANLPTTTCRPFVCAGGACKTSCDSDADCAFGYHCDKKSGCVLVTAPTCAAAAAAKPDVPHVRTSRG
jgi:hypothetical protein